MKNENAKITNRFPKQRNCIYIKGETMKDLNELFREVLNDQDLHASELPAIDLYLDQIITILEGKYSSGKRKESDKLLTNTMIHNYRKVGLIKPVKGKKYANEHIMQMLIIFAMKNSLSLQEIKTVFDSLYADPLFNSEALVQCYEDALYMKEKERETLPAYLSALLGIPDTQADIKKENNPAELFSILLSITFLAGHLQRIAEEMVDEYFTLAPGRAETL